MRVIDAKVDWKEDVGNNPRLQVLVDNIPPMESMVFESAKNENIWYAEKGGYRKCGRKPTSSLVG